VSTLLPTTGEEVTMHVLVATTQRQGQVDDDFCYTIEGELVRLPFLECDCGDSCGCTRSFAGLTSHRATTTAVVAERPDLNCDNYTELLFDDLVDDLDKAGLALPPELRAMVEDEVDWLCTNADLRPVGAVVRRRGDWAIGYKPLAVA
jgi:hypothetical protein